MTEAQLQREAEKLLNWLKDTGRIRDYYHRPDRRAGHNERAGLPDLVIAGAHESRCSHCTRSLYAIELKIGKNKTTKAQDQWLAAYGPWGAVCRSMDEVHHRLREWGII